MLTLPQKKSNVRSTSCLYLFAGFMLVLICGPMSETIQAAPMPKKSNQVIICQDEQLTVKATSVPLEQLLDAICKTCNLRIFTPSKDKTTNKLIDVDINGQKLEQALSDLLKGCDYLIVYNEDSENAGLVASSVTSSPTDKFSQTINSSQDEAPYVVLSEEEEQTEFIRQEIATLKDRIASGTSDRMYEIAIKSKPAEFVQNDRQLLASYEERLADMAQ